MNTAPLVCFNEIKGVVTDIEGTTGSISFVHQVLFPYAKAHLPEFIRQNADNPEVAEQLRATRLVMAQPNADLEVVITQLLQWIADDQKVTPLKALQGLAWESGYRSGDYTGHLYPDAHLALQQWYQQGLALYIYSSGSVYAQKLLFGYSDFGDLNAWFKGYFDTRIGGKRESDSYRNIHREIGLPPEQLLFLSDVVEELDAAKAAGFQTVQLVRSEGMITGDHPQVSGFDQLAINV